MILMAFYNQQVGLNSLPKLGGNKPGSVDLISIWPINRAQWGDVSCTKIKSISTNSMGLIITLRVA